MFFCYIVKTKQHYFICNTPSASYEILRLQNAHAAEIPPLLSAAYWIFFSLFCSHLIQIQKIIPVSFLKYMTNMIRICFLWASVNKLQ